MVSACFLLLLNVLHFSRRENQWYLWAWTTLKFLGGKIKLFLQITFFKENEFAKFYFTIFHIYQLSYFTLFYFCFCLPGRPTKISFAFFIKRETSLVTGRYKEKIERTSVLIIPLSQNRRASHILFSWLCIIKENHCSVYSELFCSL